MVVIRRRSFTVRLSVKTARLVDNFGPTSFGDDLYPVEMYHGWLCDGGRRGGGYWSCKSSVRGRSKD